MLVFCVLMLCAGQTQAQDIFGRGMITAESIGIDTSDIAYESQANVFDATNTFYDSLKFGILGQPTRWAKFKMRDSTDLNESTFNLAKSYPYLQILSLVFNQTNFAHFRLEMGENGSGGVWRLGVSHQTGDMYMGDGTGIRYQNYELYKGKRNTLYGGWAGRDMQDTVIGNTLVGWGAMEKLTVGDTNTVVGFEAGRYAKVTRRMNVFGSNSGILAGDSDVVYRNTTVIGNNAYTQSSNSIILGDVTDPVNIGLLSRVPNSILTINQHTTNSGARFLWNEAEGTETSWGEIMVNSGRNLGFYQSGYKRMEIDNDSSVVRRYADAGTYWLEHFTDSLGTDDIANIIQSSITNSFRNVYRTPATGFSVNDGFEINLSTTNKVSLNNNEAAILGVTVGGVGLKVFPTGVLSNGNDARTPVTSLDLVSNSLPQLGLSYDQYGTADTTTTFTTNVNGDLTIIPSGSDVFITGRLYTSDTLGSAGTGNSIRARYDGSNFLELKNNGTNSLITTRAGTFIFGTPDGAAQWVVLSSSVLRGGTNRGQDLGSSGVRWNNSFFGNNLDVTWATNVDAGFIRGTGDTDATANYLRDTDGVKWYVTVSTLGVLTTSTTAP